MGRTAILRKPPVTIAVALIILYLAGASKNLGSPALPNAFAEQNTTAVLQQLQSDEHQNQIELAKIKNLTSTQLMVSRDISSGSARFATQAAYTALSVFFLGLALVIFGLGLTSKAAGRVGRYFTMMVWSLTIPVLLLVALFQIGILTDSPLKISDSDQPFFLLSLLLYIPIGIVLFLLIAQRRITPSQTAISASAPMDSIRQLESISKLRETGRITEEDYQRLKSKVITNL